MTKVPKHIPILVHSVNAVQGPVMAKKLVAAGFSVTHIRIVILEEARFKTWLAEVEDTLDLPD